MEAGIHELTAGYALDALDSEERDAFEAHLAGCERCQEELTSFWQVTGALAVAATGAPPSDSLRERILADARSERQNVIPLESRRQRLLPVLSAAAAIAAAVAVGLGLYAVSLNGELDDTQAALAHQTDVASVLADPDARSVALQSGDGRVVVADSGDAVLVLNDAKPLPEGKTYQAWVIGTDRKPHPAGTFEPANGKAVVKVGRPVHAQGIVAVTVEDEGGATTPTLPLVDQSEPA
jgi:anti-sigma-K factor RskA